MLKNLVERRGGKRQRKQALTFGGGSSIDTWSSRDGKISGETPRKTHNDRKMCIVKDRKRRSGWEGKRTTGRTRPHKDKVKENKSGG